MTEDRGGQTDQLKFYSAQQEANAADEKDRGTFS